MEEIQLAVAEATNNMQSPAEGTGAQSLPTGAQSLPAAAQGEEYMDQFSEGSFQVGSTMDESFLVCDHPPSDGSFQVAPTEGSFQVCDHPPNKTLLYRSQMVVVEGGPSHYRPPSAAQIPAPVNADGSEPAAAQEATTQSQQSAAQIPAVEAVDSEPAGGGSGGEKEAAQTATPAAHASMEEPPVNLVLNFNLTDNDAATEVIGYADDSSSILTHGQGEISPVTLGQSLPAAAQSLPAAAPAALAQPRDQPASAAGDVTDASSWRGGTSGVELQSLRAFWILAQR